MTASARIPAAEAALEMADTPDPAPPVVDRLAASDAAGSARRLSGRDWTAIVATVLGTLLGGAIVGLLIYTLNTTNDRFTQMDARFAQVDARFAAQDAKIAQLDAKIDEINLKLTALIAALNATEAVDAALDGRLTGSNAAAVADPAGQVR